MKLLPPYSITLLLPAFHPVLDVVVLGRMTFDFRAGGEVAASYESLVSSTGMYKTTSDFVRAGFEVLLLLWTTLQLIRELKEIVSVSAMEYLQNMFNWLDLGSIAAVYFGACLYARAPPRNQTCADAHGAGTQVLSATRRSTSTPSPSWSSRARTTPCSSRRSTTSCPPSRRCVIPTSSSPRSTSS